MTELGQTETSASRFGMSVLPPEADTVRLHAQVRLVPKADHTSHSQTSRE